MKTYIFRDLCRSFAIAAIFTMVISTAFGQEYRTGTGKACNSKATARITVIDVRPNATQVRPRRLARLFSWHPKRRRTHRSLIVK